MTVPSSASPDARRCSRSDGRGWRCGNLRAPGHRLCHHHALLAASRHVSTKKKKKKKPVAISDDPPPPSPAPRPPSPTPAALVRRVVALGEIWALPYDSDRRPRAYARIERIHPTVSMIEVAPLEFHPSSPDELRWAAARLPIACGTFRPSTPTALKPISSLSHLVHCGSYDEPPPSVYRVFPNKGEVWAVYRDCDDLSGSARSPLYDLVEVVLGFTEDDGVTVVALAGGTKGLFRRQFVDGYQLVRTFAKSELPLFSHRVPAFRLAGENWHGAQGILWRVGQS